VYGFHEDKKKDTWELIKNLSSSTMAKWICVGDFNDTLNLKEKRGGIPRSFAQLQIGRDVMESCSLLDLGFWGYPFTWSNKRGGPDNVQCRLNRTMATKNFINRYSPIRVNHLARFNSDHVAIVVILEEIQPAETRKKKHIFRFEEVWSKEENCERMIRQNWNSSHGRFEEKLAAM